MAVPQSAKSIPLVIFLLLFMQAGLYAEYSIAIQPLGPFDSVLIAPLISEIKAQFENPKVILCKVTPLPAKAYYAPRNRYRAEILLEYLDSLRNGRYTRILGLTQKDISTTKGQYPDWGIFGLGALGNGPCVVSIFRLKKTGEPQLFMERYVKVVIHELGHTFGLNHCSDPSCIMTDYKGTIKSLDVSKKQFCTKCHNLLAKGVMFYSTG